MRELKFRAWIHKLNCWADEVLVSCIANVWGYVGSDSNGIPYYNCDLEQYTGLKDKNGKEIYEGDIAAWKNASGFNDGMAVVEWNNNGAWYIVNDDAGVFDYLDDVAINCEVIGNIHENPELLKGDVN